MKDCLEKIKALRMSKGYTQNYMAFELEIAQRTYSKIERNQIELTVRRLKEIAFILEVDAKELLC